jgi:hypothetical protein
VRPAIQERTDDGRSLVGRNGHRQRRSPTSVRTAAVCINQQTRCAYLVAHKRAYTSGPADESPADLVTPSRSAPEIHHDRVERFVAIELNATAAIVGQSESARAADEVCQSARSEYRVSLPVVWVSTVLARIDHACGGNTPRAVSMRARE